jgi:hypothetical protein
VATGVAAGTAHIRARAGGLDSNAATLTVRVAGSMASSAELIDAALAAGAIDAETALAYKVWAVYQDPRLPAAYRGDDSGSFETYEVNDVHADFDNLSPATQEMLAPYLLRPADVGSWRDPGVRAALAAARTAATREKPLNRPTCQGSLSGWAPFDTTNGKVRVWYHTDFLTDGIVARKVAQFIDNDVWPMLITSLGFNEPLSDTRLTGCYGGDGRLDIYIVVMGDRGQTIKSTSYDSDKIAAQYILINPQQTDDELKLTTAHELMHAIHWAHQTAATQRSYGWFRDALANWAADQVYSGIAPLNQLASCHFKSPHLSLNDESTGYCHGLPRLSRNYGAYLPLQFLSKTRGTAIVKSILVATGTHGTAIEAIDSTVGGGFKAFWPEYARKLWNQDPVLAKDGPSTFDGWDKLPTNAPVRLPVLAPDRPAKFNANLAGSLEDSTPTSDEIRNVSSKYYHYTFSDPNTRSVIVHNTYYENWKNGQAVSVHAFFKVAGSASWDEEDWTEFEWIGFCRDFKLQRLQELVVVYASAEWTGVTNPKVIAPQAPELMRNVIGCWSFVGEAKRTTTWSAGSGKVGTSVATFNARFETNFGGVPNQYFNRSEGKLRTPITAPLFSGGSWTLVENYAAGSCKHQLNSGGSSAANTAGGDATGLILTNNFTETLNATQRAGLLQITGPPSLAYVGEGHSTKIVTGQVSSTQPGVECGSTYESGVGAWWLTRGDDPNSRRVDQADGRLKGGFTVPGLGPGESVVYTWDLAPVPQP